MKNVLVTGGTGMIGKLVLEHCLKSSEIQNVISLVRRSSGLQNAKLQEEIINDFETYDNNESLFENIDIAYFCLGVYTGAVDREQFRKITVDFTKSFIDQLKAKSPKASFCFLSGRGADSSEKSRVMFAKDKGIAENILIRAGFPQTYIFRPAYIYPVTSRKEPNLMYSISRALYPVMKRLFPASTITSIQLASAIFKSGISGAPQTVLENEDIKAIS